MTTPHAVDTPDLQPNNQHRTSSARDVSIADLSWVAAPRIYGNYLFVQTPPCLKGASDNHVC